MPRTNHNNYVTLSSILYLYEIIFSSIQILALERHLIPCEVCFQNKSYYCSTVSAINFFFAHSGQIISSASVMNPFPTMDALQEEQTKQLLCQCLPSKDMNRVPPIPTGWSIKILRLCIYIWISRNNNHLNRV